VWSFNRASGTGTFSNACAQKPTLAATWYRTPGLPHWPSSPAASGLLWIAIMHGSRVFNGAFRHNVTVWLLPSFFRKRFVLDYLSNTVKILKISKDSINRRYLLLISLYNLPHLIGIQSSPGMSALLNDRSITRLYWWFSIMPSLTSPRTRIKKALRCDLALIGCVKNS
jgi:hypothetical protein